MSRADEGVAQRAVGAERAALGVEHPQGRARLGRGIAHGGKQAQAVSAQRLVEGGAAIDQVRARVGRHHGVQSQTAAGAEGIIEEDAGLDFIGAKVARAAIVQAQKGVDLFGLDQQGQVGGAGHGLGCGQNAADIHAAEIAGQQKLALHHLGGQRLGAGDAFAIGLQIGTRTTGVALDVHLVDIALQNLDLEHAAIDLLGGHHGAHQDVAGIAVEGGDLAGHFIGIGQADGTAYIRCGDRLELRIGQHGVAFETHARDREGRGGRIRRRGRLNCVGNIQRRAHRRRGGTRLETLVEMARLRRRLRQCGQAKRNNRCGAHSAAQIRHAGHSTPQPCAVLKWRAFPEIVRKYQPFAVPFCNHCNVTALYQIVAK